MKIVIEFGSSEVRHLNLAYDPQKYAKTNR